MNKTLKKYVPIIYSFAAIVIFLSALKQFDGVLWHWMDAIITIGTVIGVWYNYNENRKQLETVKIYIQEENKNKVEIPSFIVRKNFTRSEVKGILRELDANETYQIDYISNPQSSFLKEISEIQKGNQDELVIPITSNDKFILKYYDLY